jgi:5-methylcytosine-specific restriction endonuclease McrA
VLIVVDESSLLGDDQRPGFTDQGDIIGVNRIRQLIDNAELRRVVRGNGEILEVGRGIRLATDAHYQALVARDGCCRWPGCTTPARYCDVDHFIPWEAGGTTNLDNLWLLCAFHHHQKHRSDIRVSGTVLDAQIHLPDGTTRRSRPPGHDRATAA